MLLCCISYKIELVKIEVNESWSPVKLVMLSNQKSQSELCFCNLVFFVLFFSTTGIDNQLARHYAHLFIRDPLSLFQEHIHEDDEQHTNHFEVQLIWLH